MCERYQASFITFSLLHVVLVFLYMHSRSQGTCWMVHTPLGDSYIKMTAQGAFTFHGVEKAILLGLKTSSGSFRVTFKMTRDI